MLSRIDELKKELDKLMAKDNKDTKEILKISEELDVLIVEYYKMTFLLDNED